MSADPHAGFTGICEKCANSKHCAKYNYCGHFGRTVLPPIPSPAQPTDDVHSCSYQCNRPACIKVQRDELRDKLLRSVDRAPRRVACAAVRAEDGDVLLGIRHYSMDMHKQIKARTDGEKFTHRQGEDQGFVDQRGVYMTRTEAFQVAQAAGQIFDLNACREGSGGWKLYSEGIY